MRGLVSVVLPVEEHDSCYHKKDDIDGTHNKGENSKIGGNIKHPSYHCYSGHPQSYYQTTYHLYCCWYSALKRTVGYGYGPDGQKDQDDCDNGGCEDLDSHIENNTDICHSEEDVDCHYVDIGSFDVPKKPLDDRGYSYYDVEARPYHYKYCILSVKYPVYYS